MRHSLAIPKHEQQPIDVAKPVNGPEPVERVKPVEPALPQSAKRLEQATREPVRPVEQAPPTPPLVNNQKPTEGHRRAGSEPFARRSSAKMAR